MKDFYFTFGSGQPNAPGYARVTAPDEGKAREAMVNQYGTHWSNLYHSIDEIDRNDRKERTHIIYSESPSLEKPKRTGMRLTDKIPYVMADKAVVPIDRGVYLNSVITDLRLLDLINDVEEADIRARLQESYNREMSEKDIEPEDNY